MGLERERERKIYSWPGIAKQNTVGAKVENWDKVRIESKFRRVKRAFDIGG